MAITVHELHQIVSTFWTNQITKRLLKNLANEAHEFAKPSPSHSRIYSHLTTSQTPCLRRAETFVFEVPQLHLRRQGCSIATFVNSNATACTSLECVKLFVGKNGREKLHYPHKEPKQFFRESQKRCRVVKSGQPFLSESQSSCQGHVLSAKNWVRSTLYWHVFFVCVCMCMQVCQYFVTFCLRQSLATSIRVLSTSPSFALGKSQHSIILDHTSTILLY